ncbi:MAG TPA: CDP-alcohol phosphatidyltransferase family protein [Patescibacteria group bacterium]|nr:CDP-alcohol phosphatidyltransferase family protein [Patescibacteria group bacterium]
MPLHDTTINVFQRFLEFQRQSARRDPSLVYPHDHLLARTILPLIPLWVKPNHVTVIRFCLIPFVLWLLLLGWYKTGIPLFFVAAFTDALDGSLARVRKQITPWGTFYDPVADKLLIGSVVLFIAAKHVHPWFALLIVSVEIFIVLGGVVRRKKGKITSANFFGKTKMVLQVVGILLLLLGVWTQTAFLLTTAVGILGISVAFALVSLVTYGL